MCGTCSDHNSPEVHQQHRRLRDLRSPLEGLSLLPHSTGIARTPDPMRKTSSVLFIALLSPDSMPPPLPITVGRTLPHRWQQNQQQSPPLMPPVRRFHRIDKKLTSDRRPSAWTPSRSPLREIAAAASPRSPSNLAASTRSLALAADSGRLTAAAALTDGGCPPLKSRSSHRPGLCRSRPIALAAAESAACLCSWRRLPDTFASCLRSPSRTFIRRVLRKGTRAGQITRRQGCWPA